MTGNKSFGNRGEMAVEKYLKSAGYIIAARNYRTRAGEIDIIAQNRNIVAFVEVKTRSANSMIAPREAVDIHKQSRIAAAAAFYISRTSCVLDPRFDVAEVIVDPEDINGQSVTINYIENAFTPEESLWI